MIKIKTCYKILFMFIPILFWLLWFCTHIINVDFIFEYFNPFDWYYAYKYIFLPFIRIPILFFFFPYFYAFFNCFLAKNRLEATWLFLLSHVTQVLGCFIYLLLYYYFVSGDYITYILVKLIPLFAAIFILMVNIPFYLIYIVAKTAIIIAEKQDAKKIEE